MVVSKGKYSRVGLKFSKAIEKIKIERIKRGKSSEKISSEKITNLIIKHKEAWKIIEEDIINLSDEEIDEKWK